MMRLSTSRQYRISAAGRRSFANHWLYTRPAEPNVGFLISGNQTICDLDFQDNSEFIAHKLESINMIATLIRLIAAAEAHHDPTGTLTDAQAKTPS